MTSLRADLPAFFEQAADPKATVRRYEGLRDGGAEWIERPVLISAGVETDVESGGALLLCKSQSGRVEMDSAALGLPISWKGMETLEVDVESVGAPSVFVRVWVKTNRGRLIESCILGTGEKATVRIPLEDLPLSQGVQDLYNTAAICIEVQQGQQFSEGAMVEQTDPDIGSSMDEIVKLRVHRVELKEATGPVGPVVDPFGQRANKTWPEKIMSMKELRQRGRDEDLDESLTYERSRFGGFALHGGYKATGYFRVEKVDGRWWFVDPEGYLYWSIGTTGVRLRDTTTITGREHLFAQLPDANGPYADARNVAVNSPANDPKGKETVAFYAWNVLRKYESKEEWRQRVIDRFRSWGFNTFGNWSEPFVLDQEQMSFTHALTSRFDNAPKIGKRMPDVFDPRWEEIYEAHIIEETSQFKDNPWLLGYFVDNEMPWGSLIERLPQSSPDSAAKSAWVDFVIDVAGSPEEVGRLLGVDAAKRDDLIACTFDELPDEGDGYKLLYAASGFYTEHYFERVHTLLKKHDPNHLYLGCRFVRRRPNDLICAAAGRYCDVVTVNSYDLWPRRPQFEEWHDKVGGKPILIAEHHLPRKTNRQVPPLYPAFTAEERETLYVNLVRKWASQPWSLGCHWYQHADQHLTGRPTDGENQPVGFVDITDTPYPELVRAARASTARMIEWAQKAE